LDTVVDVAADCADHILQQSATALPLVRASLNHVRQLRQERLVNCVSCRSVCCLFICFCTHLLLLTFISCAGTVLHSELNIALSYKSKQNSTCLWVPRLLFSHTQTYFDDTPTRSYQQSKQVLHRGRSFFLRAKFDF
jgi:hypothetical protein